MKRRPKMYMIDYLESQKTRRNSHQSQFYQGLPQLFYSIHLR